MPEAEQIEWSALAEGDRLKSVANGKFYEVLKTVRMSDGVHITLDLGGKPKTVIRPTPIEPKATVQRGPTGKAVDVWIEVLSSGGN
jgi:hypothetical protein